MGIEQETRDNRGDRPCEQPGGSLNHRDILAEPRHRGSDLESNEPAADDDNLARLSQPRFKIYGIGN